MAIDYQWTDEKLSACWHAFWAERARQFGEVPTPKVLYEGDVFIQDDARFSDVHPSVALLGVDFQYIGQRVHIVVTEATNG